MFSVGRAERMAFILQDNGARVTLGQGICVEVCTETVAAGILQTRRALRGERGGLAEKE